MPTATDAVPVIAVDGPGGSGKGTLAQQLARRLGFHLLDSGALYRLTAHAAIARNIALDDETALAQLAPTLDIVFEPSAEDVVVRLSGNDVTQQIRTESCGAAASLVAALPAVRNALLVLQRSFRRAPGLVADGRDMGTVVFVDAALKIFLTASAEERARRRYKQLKDKGFDVNLRALLRDLQVRDQRDSQRSVAPLHPAEDAIVMDSTGMSVDAVLVEALKWVATRLPHVSTA